jgi:hypothetical protein
MDVMAGIRRAHGRPPRQKEAVLGDDVLAMISTLPNDLRGWRDRAILLLGFAAAFVAPKSSALIVRPSKPKTAMAGSRFFRVEFCSSSEARPAGAPLRSRAAPRAHLSGCSPRDLAQARAHQPRPPLPPHA